MATSASSRFDPFAKPSANDRYLRGADAETEQALHRHDATTMQRLADQKAASSPRPRLLIDQRL
jgi:hypothetical protein